MNLLIVHNYYQIPGGEDTVVANERRMLEAHGHSVRLYTRDNSELSSAGGLRRLWLYLESFYSIRTYREVRAILKRERIDVVHVHNTAHLISPSVYDAARSLGVPVVQTLHNFRMLCPGATLYRNGHICEDCIRGGYLCAVRHCCYRGSRAQTAAVALSGWLQRRRGVWGRIHYICLTESHREMLRSKYGDAIPERHVHVKPNFTTEPLPQQPQADEGGGDGGLGESGYYVAIGRLERIKGTHLIVKAFAHGGWPLVLIGCGEQEAQIRAYLERHHISNIRLAGQLVHEEAMALLRGARALVIMPQWYETFGMNVIEAYAQGVPVISNDVGNAAALVEDGVTGVRCVNTVDGLCEALRRFEGIAADRSAYGKLRAAAYVRYQALYSEEANYRELIRIYTLGSVTE